nr:uncharacterized protein LOC107443043 isoform X1 [Parasteatoda tepidariorum]
MNGLENIRAGVLNAPNRGILRTESISRSVLWIVEKYHTLQNAEHSLCSDIFRVPMFPNCFIYLSLNFENGKYLLRINKLVRNRATFNALCSTIKIKFLIEDPSCDLCQKEEMEIPNEDLSCPVIINHISASSSVILPRLEIRCTVTINVSCTPFQNPADIQKKMKDYTTNMSSQELHEHLDVLLADDTDSKVVLRVGEEFFNVHKTLLCSHSPVFAAMFEHEMLEKSQSEICINDITPNTETKDSIQARLALLGESFDHIIDVKWRQDYVIKSSNCEKICEPKYIIQLKTWNPQMNQEKDVIFSCTMEQLQNLVLKLKDATKCIERNAV